MKPGDLVTRKLGSNIGIVIYIQAERWWACVFWPNEGITWPAVTDIWKL